MPLKPSAAMALALVLGTSGPAPAQPQSTIPPEEARAVFATAQSLCEADAGALWGMTLCGPIMLADPGTRAIVTSHPDGEGRLEPRAGLHAGRLPDDQNIANTALDWAGVRWTQLVWPLHGDPVQQPMVLMHEAFHRVQPALGIAGGEAGDNAHLDTVDGRWLMQLEWRALAAALQAGDAEARARAIADALAFRDARHQRFPGAAASERALMLNEGLAEYTGVRLGSGSEGAAQAAALAALEARGGDASFVRSFAAASGPAYGLLLDRVRPSWRTDVVASEPAALIARASSASSAGASGLPARAARYGGPALREAEDARERQREGERAAYRARFVDAPVLRIALRQMKVQFRPTDLVPLDPHGTVYPTMRITDAWGVLEVDGGALLAKDWKTVTVPAPADAGTKVMAGDGWTLQLADGWRIVSGERAGDFALEQAVLPR